MKMIFLNMAESQKKGAQRGKERLRLIPLVRKDWNDTNDDFESFTILVGRVTPCAPQRGRFEDGAHGLTRHGKGMTGLFYDGHAGQVISTKLRVSNFREPGSGPPVPGYPGE